MLTALQQRFSNLDLIPPSPAAGQTSVALNSKEISNGQKDFNHRGSFRRPSRVQHDPLLCGYDASEAENGSEGIRKTLAEAPDLILMDVSLADVSGVRAGKNDKENPETTKILIVACPGWTHTDVNRGTESWHLELVKQAVRCVMTEDLFDAIVIVGIWTIILVVGRILL